MYNKTSFKENADYFSHSNVFDEIKKALDPKNQPKGRPYYELEDLKNPEKLINLTIQLFMENIIKHHFSSFMLGKGSGGLDNMRFLSEENSQEVYDKFKPLANYPKKNRNAPQQTQEEENLERITYNVYEEVIGKMINYIFTERDVENRDLCENMKEEFGAFIENKHTSKHHIKHKP